MLSYKSVITWNLQIYGMLSFPSKIFSSVKANSFLAHRQIWSRERLPQGTLKGCHLQSLTITILSQEVQRIWCCFCRDQHVTLPTKAIPFFLFQCGLYMKSSMDNIGSRSLQLLKCWSYDCPVLNCYLWEQCLHYSTNVLDFLKCDWEPRDRNISSAYNFTVAAVER